jgi:hypothetical protein
VKHGNDGWALKCDIHHYFKSIPHDVAKAAIHKRVKDPDVRNQVDYIVDSYDGDCGLGLGSQVNQLIALTVLDDLDHFIKEKLRIKHYVRYNDDFVLIHESLDYLKYCLSEISKWLESVGLRLNNKTAFCRLSDGFWMLKWRFVLCDSGKILKRMKREKISRQKKHISKVYALEKAGKVPPGTSNNSMRSIMANAKRGDTFYSRKSLAQHYYDITGGIKYHDYAGTRKKSCQIGSNLDEKSDRYERQRSRH